MRDVPMLIRRGLAQEFLLMGLVSVYALAKAIHVTRSRDQQGLPRSAEGLRMILCCASAVSSRSIRNSSPDVKQILISVMQAKSGG